MAKLAGWSRGSRLDNVRECDCWPTFTAFLYSSVAGDKLRRLLQNDTITNLQYTKIKDMLWEGDKEMHALGLTLIDGYGHKIQ